ncbi:Hypothetical predicted protein [Pelobates cultripes]|uniref:Uncharacterized protein n=1 Tax=Pelobates cultripes TaxID=61616 RepID=A0AAD1VNP7_PELCU|nr:Hypothetical predicted protein [Pelobates cultripes]
MPEKKRLDAKWIFQIQTSDNNLSSSPELIGNEFQQHFDHSPPAQDTVSKKQLCNADFLSALDLLPLTQDAKEKLARR